jgi:hypothetical protein
VSVTLYRLQPLRPPVAMLSPGLYLYRVDGEAIEVELSRPIRPADLAALVRSMPHAKRIAA